MKTKKKDKRNDKTKLKKRIGIVEIKFPINGEVNTERTKSLNSIKFKRHTIFSMNKWTQQYFFLFRLVCSLYIKKNDFFLVYSRNTI